MTRALNIPRWSPPLVDVTRPQSARVYDYFLGGKNNFAVDREAAETIASVLPNVRTICQANRRFLRQAVTYLAGDRGIRQFLDIGTGIPTSPNTHEIAQGLLPDARVVYVDNDPVVLAHARAELVSRGPGRAGYVHADARAPERILSDSVTTSLLDFEEPVALLFIGLLHFLPDADRPADVVRKLVAAVPSGSYVAATHVTGEYDPDAMRHAERMYQAQGIACQLRTGRELEDMLLNDTGLRLVGPGTTLVSEWCDDDAAEERLPASKISCNGLVAHKP